MDAHVHSSHLCCSRCEAPRDEVSIAPYYSLTFNHTAYFCVECLALYSHSYALVEEEGDDNDFGHDDDEDPCDIVCNEIVDTCEDPM